MSLQLPSPSSKRLTLLQGMYQGGMMGQEAGFNRLSMGPGGRSGEGMSFRGEGPMPMGRYGQREGPQGRGMQGHLGSHSADNNFYDSMPSFQDEMR